MLYHTKWTKKHLTGIKSKNMPTCQQVYYHQLLKAILKTKENTNVKNPIKSLKKHHFIEIS